MHTNYAVLLIEEVATGRSAKAIGMIQSPAPVSHEVLQTLAQDAVAARVAEAGFGEYRAAVIPCPNREIASEILTWILAERHTLESLAAALRAMNIASGFDPMAPGVH